MDRKVLSVKQPWAGLIFNGKDVENRTWYTRYRGPLLIHASQRADKEAFRFFGTPEGRVLSGFDTLPAICNVYGAILGQVSLETCSHRNGRTVSKWHDPDQCAWRLARPAIFEEPIECKGQLSIFDAPPDVAVTVDFMLQTLNA